MQDHWNCASMLLLRLRITFFYFFFIYNYIEQIESAFFSPISVKANIFNLNANSLKFVPDFAKKNYFVRVTVFI